MLPKEERIDLLKQYAQNFEETSGETPKFEDFFNDSIRELGGKSHLQKVDIQVAAKCWESAGLGKSDWETIYIKNYTILNSEVDEMINEKITHLTDEDLWKNANYKKLHYGFVEIKDALSWTLGVIIASLFYLIALISFLAIGKSNETHYIYSLLISSGILMIVYFIWFKMNKESIYLKNIILSKTGLIIVIAIPLLSTIIYAASFAFLLLPIFTLGALITLVENPKYENYKIIKFQYLKTTLIIICLVWMVFWIKALYF